VLAGLRGAADDPRIELDQLKAEEREARADRKAKLQAQIARLSKRVDAKLDRAKARSRQASEEFAGQGNCAPTAGGQREG
jgi:hypothetical protein